MDTKLGNVIDVGDFVYLGIYLKINSENDSFLKIVKNKVRFIYVAFSNSLITVAVTGGKHL